MVDSTEQSTITEEDSIMGIPMAKERRLGSRKKLTGLLPGRLQTTNGVDIECKPVDISPTGLGLILNVEYDAGTKLQLVMKDKNIELKVAWVQRDFGKKDLFRYGLITADQQFDLESLFEKSGCLV
jgi:hypothetical protein